MGKLSDAQVTWVKDFLTKIGGGASSGPAIADGNGNSDVLARDQRVSSDSSPGSPSQPIPHPKFEAAIEFFDKGGFKGSGVISVERGQSGIALSESAWKALQQKTTVKLNEISAKFEAKLLSGQTELGEIIDGLTVDFEASAGKADVSSKGLDVTLMTFTVKLVGDVSHWARQFGIGVPEDVKVKFEGRLQGSVGNIPKLKEALKKKITDVMTKHADEIVQAEKIDNIAKEIDGLHKEKGKVIDEISKLRKEEIELSRKGKTLDASAKNRLADLEAKRKEFDGKYIKARDKMKQEVLELNTKKSLTEKARDKLKGKFEKAVAKAAATKTAQFIGKILLKAIPIVNIISTIIDIVDLLKNLKNLFKRYEKDGAMGGDGDDGDKGKVAGKGEGTGPSDGPVTSPRQVDKTPPPGSQPGKTPDKKDPREATGPTDRPVTSPRQVDKTLPPGPDQSPGKKPVPAPSGGIPSAKPPKPADPNRFDNDPRVVLMRSFPDKVVGQWFALERNTLVVTQGARDWIKQHVGKSSDGLFIKSATPKVITWKATHSGGSADVSFEYLIDGKPKRHSHSLSLGFKDGKLFTVVRAGEPEIK